MFDEITEEIPGLKVVPHPHDHKGCPQVRIITDNNEIRDQLIYRIREEIRGFSLEQIGEMFGLTRSRIQQIHEAQGVKRGKPWAIEAQIRRDRARREFNERRRADAHFYQYHYGERTYLTCPVCGVGPPPPEPPDTSGLVDHEVAAFYEQQYLAQKGRAAHR